MPVASHRSLERYDNQLQLRPCDSEKDKLRGLDCFVVNGLRKEPHISHFNLEEALQLIDDVRPERAFITHISHQMGFHCRVQAELPPNVSLAYDGLEIVVPQG